MTKQNIRSFIGDIKASPAKVLVELIVNYIVN